MKTLTTLNKPDIIPGINTYDEEKKSHFAVRLIKCCIGFIMFEWLVGQTFTDVIGLNIIECLIGLAFFLLYLTLAIKYKEDMVESMF